jgi:hypothetical protein
VIKLAHRGRVGTSPEEVGECVLSATFRDGHLEGA